MALHDLIAELRSDAPEFAQVWDEKPRTRSLDHLEASIHGLSGYFYPVGSGAYEDDVRYFQEREWRIISRITQHGVALTEELNPTIKGELVSMDPRYFVLVSVAQPSILLPLATG